MKERLIEILESTGVEVYEQGSVTDEESYPENFFTYWNDDTEDEDHYDNRPHSCIWYFTINFYSINPLICTTMILKAKKLLEENGWTVDGKGKDVYSGLKSHSGRSIEAIYKEKEM